MGPLISRSLSFPRANSFASTSTSMATSWEPILRLVSLWLMEIRMLWREMTLMEEKLLPDSSSFPSWACYDTSPVAPGRAQERLVGDPDRARRFFTCRMRLRSEWVGLPKLIRCGTQRGGDGVKTSLFFPLHQHYWSLPVGVFWAPSALEKGALEIGKAPERELCSPDKLHPWEGRAERACFCFSWSFCAILGAWGSSVASDGSRGTWRVAFLPARAAPQCLQRSLGEISCYPPGQG